MKATSLRQKEALQTATSDSKGKASANPLKLIANENEKEVQPKDNPLQMDAKNTNPIQLFTERKEQSVGDNPLHVKKENKTGLPKDLKAGVEALSGFSMDDVKVHYNSEKPAQLQALAYTQGSDIHVAPGQDEYLSHEVWHVVQQKQGRVQPTLKMLNDINVNDDEKLESEANRFRSEFEQNKPEKTLIPLSPVSTVLNNVTSNIRPLAVSVVQLAGKNGGTQGKSRKRKLEEKDSSEETEKLKPAKKKKNKDSDSLKAENESELQRLIGFKGANQEGKTSKRKGKLFAGPETYQNQRVKQVTRHITSLVLNRLTLEQKEKLGQKPVEVQMSSVGGILLLSTNSKAASQALFDAIEKEDGLYSYIDNIKARTNTQDNDLERPKANFAKVKSAIKGERKWQEKGNVNEDEQDVKKANAMLEALKTKTVGLLDPANKQELEKNVKNFGEKRVYVVLHSPSDAKPEHAERVQSKIRKQYLKDYENDLSTPPGGPKTPCLGCASKHEVEYPEFGLDTKYVGNFFQEGSPVEGKAEEDAAINFVKTQPSATAVTREGYLAKSLYPDSDTDNEGNLVYPRPSGFTVAFDEPNPTEMEWITEPGKKEDYSTKKGRQDIIKMRERRQKKKKEQKKKLKSPQK
jgi:hypothetical protein